MHASPIFFRVSLLQVFLSFAKLPRRDAPFVGRVYTEGSFGDIERDLSRQPYIASQVAYSIFNTNNVDNGLPGANVNGGYTTRQDPEEEGRHKRVFGTS